MVIRNEEETNQLVDENIQTRSESTNRLANPHRNVHLVLCGLCLATYGTAEIGHFAFSVALFQNLDIHLSATASAHIMSILSSTYTIGRLASAFISIKVQPDCIISYHFAILLSSLSVLYYGRDNHWCISIGTAFLGKFFPLKLN